MISMMDDVHEAAMENGCVSVDNLVKTIGQRAFGPLITIPALLEITPLGAVPTIPTILALIIAILSVQIAFGRSHLWLPGFVRERSVSRERLEHAREKLQPVAQKLDQWFYCRLPKLTTSIFIRIAAGCCALLTLMVPPLELVPFASTIPMLAIAAFGMAIALRDGLLMLVAYLLLGGAIASAVYFAMGI